MAWSIFSLEAPKQPKFYSVGNRAVAECNCDGSILTRSKINAVIKHIDSHIVKKL